MEDIEAINRNLRMMLDKKKWEHKQLVDLAKSWLLNAKRCNPVFCERGSGQSREMPDTLGWTAKGSVLVECKSNIADFRSDKIKVVRTHPEMGMGRLRFYLLTEEVYRVAKECKELVPGWGICIIGSMGYIRQVNNMESKIWKYDERAELYYLRSRILGIQNYGR